MSVLQESPRTPGDDGPRPAAPVRVTGRAPSLREVLAAGIVVGTLALLTRIAAVPLNNTDTYFHLRFGSEFWHGWSLRDPGSVSSFATADWLPTQWLPEMVMAKVEAWFGLAGVAWLFGLQLVALTVTLLVIARRWVGPLWAALLVCVALFASYKGLSMRPQTLSFLLAAVYAGAWFRTREDGRLRWWLVPLTWLWAMVHGMWPIGIGIGLVAVAGLWLDRARPPRELARALLVPGLSAVAAAVTPLGPALYGAVLGVGSRAHYFSEWNSPDFSKPNPIVCVLLVAFTAVVMARGGKASWFDIAFLLLAGACAVWSWRTVPVAAMIMVPLAASRLAVAQGRRPARVPRAEVAFVGVASGLALAVLAVAVPHTSSEPPAQPAWVDVSLRSLPSGTKVYAEWDWGGYLMWRYPQLDLLMHGYGDTFTDAELQRNVDIETMAPGWDDQLKATGIEVAVLRPNDPVAYALTERHWTVVHASSAIEELHAPAGWTDPVG